MQPFIELHRISRYDSTKADKPTMVGVDHIQWFYPDEEGIGSWVIVGTDSYDIHVRESYQTIIQILRNVSGQVELDVEA